MKGRQKSFVSQHKSFSFVEQDFVQARHLPYKRKKAMHLRCKAFAHLSLSGRLDSNQRPPTPEAGALTGLRYTPN